MSTVLAISTVSDMLADSGFGMSINKDKFDC